MSLCVATADDLAAVLDLWSHAEAHPTNTDDIDGLRTLLATDPAALILAIDDDGAIVGSVIAGWDGWRGSVYRLVVAPSRRRAGLGRRLVDEAVRSLEARGARRLAAIVVEDDDQAVGFWHASGWEQQALRLRFVKG